MNLRVRCRDKGMLGEVAGRATHTSVAEIIDVVRKVNVLGFDGDNPAAAASAHQGPTDPGDSRAGSELLPGCYLASWNTCSEHRQFRELWRSEQFLQVLRVVITRAQTGLESVEVWKWLPSNQTQDDGPTPWLPISECSAQDSQPPKCSVLCEVK